MSLVSIDNKILFFHSTSYAGNNKYQIYDVLKDQWSLKKNEFIQDKRTISCLKLSVV